MKPARILLIVVALVAGGLAAFLATRGGDPAPQQEAQVEVLQEARARVLVASRAIGLGQRLTSDTVSWQDWPQGAVRSEYITEDMVPDAPQQVAGSVARFEFFPGEPIRETKLVTSEQGYLSAVINQGMRAVSISVQPDSASGGYIVPNDRVDIVLTPGGSDFSQTIVSNVRVLAIGNRLGEVGTTAGGANPQEPASQIFDRTEIATLELTPSQAETILNAGSRGRLALVLRSVTDFAAAPQDGGRTQAVQLIRYGQARSVASGTSRSVAEPQTSVSALEIPADAAAPAPQDSSGQVELR